MNATVGYYAGYLAGILTGGFLGWMYSTFAREKEDLYCDPDSLKEENEPPVCLDEEENEEEKNNEEEKDDPVTSKSEVLPKHQNVPSWIDADNKGRNIIYVNLTDEGLSKLLSKVAETSKGPSSPEASPVKAPLETNVTNMEDDEMFEIFKEEDSLKGKTLEEKLDIGRNLPTRPVAFPTSIGGGYATMSQMEDIKKKHEEYKEAALTRSEELEIIQAFRGIVGKNFYDAQGGVKEQGYSLHVLYVGDGYKKPAQYYSATALGVRIEDEDFSGVPSATARITEIVDVGGLDVKNRGAPRN